jgi:hypothetical protein
MVGSNIVTLEWAMTSLVFELCQDCLYFIYIQDYTSFLEAQLGIFLLLQYSLFFFFGEFNYADLGEKLS